MSIANSNSTISYTAYDAFGRLNSEYLNGNWSRDYIVDGSGNLMATENASGLCTTCYFGTDHLGSVRIVMDQYANVVARHDYLPFGEELLGTAGSTCYAGTSKPACRWWQIWCWAGSSGGTPEEFDQTAALSFLNSSSSCTNCGGNNGATNPPPAKTGTSSAPPSRRSCLNQAYATPVGKAVQFLSPISLTPLNPNWHENLAEWGLAIFGKGGGMVGSHRFTTSRHLLSGH